MKPLTNFMFEPIPNRLFKYKSDFRHLEDLLNTSEIFCPKPELLNDPFDMRFMFDEESYRNYIKRLARGFPKYFQQYKDWLEGDESGIKPDYSQFYVDMELTKYQSRFTIFSMTELENDKLAWSYYGGGYKGYCLEFNFENESRNLTDYIFQVKYQKEPIVYFDMFSFSNANKSYEFRRVKEITWQHEKEYRLVQHTNDLRYNYIRYSIDKRSLRSITFGYKVEDNVISEINRLAKENGFSDLEFYKVKIHNWDLVRERISVK